MAEVVGGCLWDRIVGTELAVAASKAMTIVEAIISCTWRLCEKINGRSAG